MNLSLAERKAVYKRALADAAWHRASLLKAPLYPPQLEAINLVERHIAGQTGDVLTIRAARQTMKNECSATLQLRAFLWNQAEGGTYIRTAPTWRPQIVNSKLRLERLIRLDPLVGGFLPREGYIYEVGSVQIMFLSTDRAASAVGATASICLDVDEAHKVDKGKFEEDFAPMTAWKSVPTVLWGVAADKMDLLYEYRSYNEDRGRSDLNLQYPASVWCELREEYARRYTSHRNKLGADHPIILTQYDLVDVETMGGYLKPHHLTSLFSGDHPKLVSPRTPPVEVDAAGRTIMDDSRPRIKRVKDAKTGEMKPMRWPYFYVATIDIGGEDEEEEDDPLKKSLGSRDSTVMHIYEVNSDNTINDFPLCHIVSTYWWVGKALSDKPSGLRGQQSILLQLLNNWRIRSCVVDARGVGEQMALYLADHWSGVQAYKATVDSISEDCFGLLAMINNDRVKVWKPEGQDAEHAEFVRQARWTKAEIRLHEKMRLIKPQSGVETRHIDFVKSLTYLPRALGQAGGLNLFF